jgi:uncharacterized protein YndB with AHSA1/START domain
MDHIRLVTTLPAHPRTVYEAWLSSLGHTAMTGSTATSEPRVGSSYSAWDGYISGEHLELEPGKRVVQSWRTTEFPEGAPDSVLEILFAADPEGTRLTLVHSGIPDGQGETYHEGWQSKYFAPMREHFAKTKPAKAARAAPAKAPKKAPSGPGLAKAPKKTASKPAKSKRPVAPKKAAVRAKPVKKSAKPAKAKKTASAKKPVKTAKKAAKAVKRAPKKGPRKNKK